MKPQNKYEISRNHLFNLKSHNWQANNRPIL